MVTNLSHDMGLELPYERESRVPRTIELQGVHYLCCVLPLLPLDREHSGKYENATHQTDHVVEEGSHNTKFNSSLIPLHKGGIREERP